MTRIKDGKSKVLAEKLACPPVNIGPRSTPNYAGLAAAAVHKIGRRRVFAGQRADAFHVDLGSIFDLGALRPVQNLHLIPMAAAAGVNSLAGVQRALDRAPGADHGGHPQREPARRTPATPGR